MSRKDPDQRSKWVNRWSIGAAMAVLAALLVAIPLWSAAHSAAYASAQGNKQTFMGNNARTGFESTETRLTPQNAPQLKQLWSYKAGGAISSQPIIANNLIYWGSWDGYEHATDLRGRQVWQTYLGKATVPGCFPLSAGVASTATVASTTINGALTSVVFVGGGDAHFYALNAATGKILWSTGFGTPPSRMIWAGGAYYNGSVYIGISSYGDCPLSQGLIAQMNPATGAVEHVFDTVANGCIGGGIWDAPAIDEATGILYVSTGTFHTCKTYEKTAISLVALRAADLSYVGSWQVPASQAIKDGDFGSTPTLFQANINGTMHRMVGLVNKNGIYYAFNRNNISAGPLWQVSISNRVYNAGGNSISASAWDGTNLYAGNASTTIRGATAGGSIRAINPATGAFRWEVPLAAPVLGGVTLVPGLVIVGSGNTVYVLNASNGAKLFSFTDPSPAARFWGVATVYNGVIYTGSRSGTLYAYGL